MSDKDTDDDAIVDAAPERLPLDAWHRAQGARMVPFAGYEMPIQYTGPSGGIVAEHTWTREKAGLFDVSHMGQLVVSGEGAAEALEALVPGKLSSLKPGNIRYTLLLDEDGGILDDLMITNMSRGEAEEFYLVVNGATKWDDIAHLREHLPDEVTLNHLEGRGLLALQGPGAAEVLEAVFPGVAEGLVFMQSTGFEWEGDTIGVARCGYTGEDGFEISVAADRIEQLAGALVAHELVQPAGLGARDSLRLEAGLPLYGHDLSPHTDPVSADLVFALTKSRREAGGWMGHAKVAEALATGPETRRVGLRVDGRMPAREGALVYIGDAVIGRVTSGGFSPTLGYPIAMAYLTREQAIEGTEVEIEVRNKRLPAKIVPMPFVPHRYYRGK